MFQKFYKIFEKKKKNNNYSRGCYTILPGHSVQVYLISLAYKGCILQQSSQKPRRVAS